MKICNQKTFLIFIVCIASLFYSCQKSAYVGNEKIYANILVPNEATNKRYYTIEGTYQIKYNLNVIFPAEKFINDVVIFMNKRGWNRLEHDSFDGRGQLNHIREGNIYQKWGGFIDSKKSIRVDLWMEDFEDKNKNVVRYSFRYEIPEGKKDINPNDRSVISILAIYMPAEIRPDPVAVRQYLDAENKKLNADEKIKRDRWMRITGP